jgi:hypothetical protein
MPTWVEFCVARGPTLHALGHASAAAGFTPLPLLCCGFPGARNGSGGRDPSPGHVPGQEAAPRHRHRAGYVVCVCPCVFASCCCRKILSACASRHLCHCELTRHRLPASACLCGFMSVCTCDRVSICTCAYVHVWVLSAVVAHPRGRLLEGPQEAGQPCAAHGVGGCVPVHRLGVLLEVRGPRQPCHIVPLWASLGLHRVLARRTRSCAHPKSREAAVPGQTVVVRWCYCACLLACGAYLSLPPCAPSHARPALLSA